MPDLVGELLSSEKSPFIHLHHVTVYREFDLSYMICPRVIAAGASTVILGPDGSDKLTFLNVFSREFYPVVGSDHYVRLMGQENWNVWELRSRPGIVSAELQQVYPTRTPGD